MTSRRLSAISGPWGDGMPATVCVRNILPLSGRRCEPRSRLVLPISPPHPARHGPRPMKPFLLRCRKPSPTPRWSKDPALETSSGECDMQADFAKIELSARLGFEAWSAGPPQVLGCRLPEGYFSVHSSAQTALGGGHSSSRAITSCLTRTKTLAHCGTGLMRLNSGENRISGPRYLYRNETNLCAKRVKELVPEPQIPCASRCITIW
jgi:hypothetical protein